MDFEGGLMAKILHVEDNPSDQGVVSVVVGEIMGHEVVSVEKISHAIEELSNDHFDLIICDGTLQQKEDGLRWAEQMAREGRKIVVLTMGGVAQGVTCLSKMRMRMEETYLKDEINKALAS